MEWGGGFFERAVLQSGRLPFSASPSPGEKEKKGTGTLHRTLTRVGVGRHLPSRQVDGFQASSSHLDSLLPCKSAQSVHISLRVHRLPKLLRAHARERVLDLDRAAQLLDVGLAVDALDAREAVGGGRHFCCRRRGFLFLFFWGGCGRGDRESGG